MSDSTRYPPGGGRAENADIPGYRGDEEADATADSNRYREQEPPLFAESGFDDLDEYLDHIDAVERERQGLPPLLPSGLRRVRPGDGRGSRQVGLRLPESDYRRLRELAYEHGVAAGTMARMLVVRAVRKEHPQPPG